MQKFNWTKMGLKILKLGILCGFILLFGQMSMNKKIRIVKENFQFNQSLGMSASALKEDDELEVIEKVEVDNEQEKIQNNQVTESEYRALNTDGLALYTLTGSLTGYAADCPKCNGTLACKSDYEVLQNGVVTYPDVTYGNVRIVASSKNLACGSIIRLQIGNISSEPILAIVLDRGVLGNNLDLLMATEDEANEKVGRKTITYDILRNGW